MALPLRHADYFCTGPSPRGDGPYEVVLLVVLAASGGLVEF
ncbi:hypothetical protein ACFVFQ_36470 [Streptomyces sp. NPDC057743]